jgi:transcriptional regulator with XRE-family HTH domain
LTSRQQDGINEAASEHEGICVIVVTLKELRKDRYMSQREVADGVNVTESTYQRWETAKASPTPRHQRELAEFFKVKPSEIDWHAKSEEPPQGTNG